MTANVTPKRKLANTAADLSPRVTVVLNTELSQWISDGSKTTGLGESAFVRMKLMERLAQERA